MGSVPKILALPNGPYSLEGAELRRSSGEVFPKKGKAALCRCGGSKSKPFCDGTHAKIGFSDRNLADPKKDRRVSYAGRRITILDNRSICSHAGYCTDGLKEVFRRHDDPWIAPDAASIERVVATIRKCPSGALSYAIGEEAQPPRRPPAVVVTDNGPYAVSGGVEPVGMKLGQGASAEHYTLCRCGASKNKPFCDGSHWNVNFHDPA
jgi:CDGSH-type Zn-finger protein